MQAIILFVMFGAFTAIVGSVITLSSSSIPQLLAQEKAVQQQTFRNLQTAITDGMVREFMQTPDAATTAAVGTYLCSRPELRQLVTCRGGVAVDFWGRNVIGFIKRDNNQLFTSGDARGIYTVRAPVTAFVLVSMGPDGLLDPRLQTQLNGLTAASTLAETQQLRAFREASATPGSDSLDDIVLTFSDRGAQDRNWADIQTGLNRIATASLRNFQTQFKGFSSNLPSVYANQFNSGPITIDDALLNQWRASGSNAPTFAAASTYTLGVDDVQAYIERRPRGQAGPGNLVLNMSGSSSTQLDIWLSSVGTTPWAIAGGTNCNSATPVNCMRVRIGT